MYLPEVYPTAVRGTGTAVVFNSARYVAAFGPLVGWSNHWEASRTPPRR